MFNLCDACYLQGFCERRFIVHMSEKTVRQPEVRLVLQNYLVGLKMPYRALVDFIVDALRDFNGRFIDEAGVSVPFPGIACILNPASEFWFRDQIADGKWSQITDVPALRTEAVGRWRLVGTARAIMEALPPRCV